MEQRDRDHARHLAGESDECVVFFIIRLAVMAHIRHVHTGYDSLIDRVGRSEARDMVFEKVQRVLGQWRTGGPG